MEYRDALKMMRGELGVSQTELANILHISVSTVSRWELGRTRPNRPIAALILDHARAHGVSAACLDALERSYTAAVKKKLGVSSKNIYTVEHASLRQLIDDASFPIYVCDLETDELLYLNQKACAMVGTEESAVGKKCYECVMHRSSPCESCHKNELEEGRFKSYDALRPFDGVVYHIQGKLIQWNGRRAQVRYVLGQESAPERQGIGAKTAGQASASDPAEPARAETGKLILQSIENENSTKQLKAIFENINGGVSVAVFGSDDRVRLAYANDRYYELFGYTKQQFAMEVKNPHDTLFPEDAEYVGAEISTIKRTRQSATFRYRIVKRDKSIAHIRCNSSVASIEGLGDKVMISVLTDVTASVQAEQQALVTGHRLDAIMKNVDSAVTASVINDDGSVDFLLTNDLYHGMLGYTKEQYESEVSEPFQLVYPADVEEVRRAVVALRHVGEEKTLQYRVVCRDGTIKWFRARISIIAFPDIAAPVQLAVFSDITDMMEATKQLAVQKDQIIEVLNETPSGIAVVETDRRDVTGTMRTIYYNDRFFSFSGYSRDEYDAMLKKNEMAFVFEEDIPKLLSDTEKICYGEAGASVDTTLRCHTKDGGFRYLLLTGQLASRRGDICVIHIALIDVTARQEAVDRQRISEEMLRIAAETDKRAMIVYDVKSNSCRAESRMLFSAKYGETFPNIPQSLIDQGIVAQDSAEELHALFARIRNGEQEIRVSLQMRSGLDKYEWFECNVATVLDANGQADKAVLVFHNITEQRVKEAVFKKWQQSIDARPAESYTLFRCNLSKDTSLDEQDGSLLKIAFPADVLTFNARTKLYVDEFVYPDDRKAYSDLLNSDSLLAMFYRGERNAALAYREIGKDGEVLWRHLTIELVEYLNSTDIQAFLMYEDIDAAKKAELKEKELAETDPLTGAFNRSAFAERVDAAIRENPSAQNALVMLDMDGFKQLNDTFGHAAGDQALQEVVAVLRSCIRNGDLVCRLGGDEFLVWLRDIPYDAVIGKIVQQMCEHIRKAYSQEVLLTASAGIAVYPRDGHGYDELYPSADKALYSVKQAGKGAYAFSSVNEEDQTPEIAEALSLVRQDQKSMRGAKRRILVVDDDEASVAMLKEIFQSEYVIETAKNGAEAMIRLRHFGASISVVLLDLVMPGMDGFDVLKKMQSNTNLRTIPVIVVTVDEGRDTLLKVIALGAAEYVTKPVDVDIIRMRVQSAISKAENERLRAQNSYLMLQRDEEVKYRTVLESTGTVVVEYDWRNHVFVYDNEISKYIAGNFDHRSLWQVFLSDMVADSADVKTMQDMMIALANDRGVKQESKLIKLKTPEGQRHWFKVIVYKHEDEFGLAEKMILTFNDVHEEVLANEKLLFQATRDPLTGLYNRAGFIEKAAELIAAKEPGYYVMSCIDIEKFKVINDQYGTAKGDEILQKFAKALTDLHQRENGICCRIMADNFAVLYPARLIGSPELERSYWEVEHLDGVIPSIRFAAGRCLVDDKTLDITAIYDRAVIAKNTVKGRYDTHVATFDESMRTTILRQQEITGQMNHALESGQFEVWLQPQFNHATGMLSGAEALVRWRHPEEGIISPAEFIPIFERNGFVYEIDKYVWEQTCILLRKWLDQGLHPVPVSVNISRYDVFREDILSVIEGLVKQYDLPLDLLRLEITESAFTESTDQIIKVVQELVDKGFTVEIDDFGSGYSSLNTLKDVPAQVLKMDMKFLENDKNAQRGGSIIESVVRMAKWLGMSVIAEGVETLRQADYLKSIGCNYIQGYLYSRPTQVVEYEKLFAAGKIESMLGKLQTAETWNNNAFWNPNSMETLIFNSYVGGACIFEYFNGKTEILRRNARYAEMFGKYMNDAHVRDDILSVLNAENAAVFRDSLDAAILTKKEASCDVKLNGCGHEADMFLHVTVRQIAQAGERHLFYCVVYDHTDQHVAEMKLLEASERVSAVMDNSHCGLSAVIAHPDGEVEYLFVNNRFYEILGYTKEQYESEVQSPFDCVYPEDRQKVFDVVTKLTAVGDTASLRLRDIRRDGRIIWLRCDMSIVRFANISQPVQMSSFLDITEQVENEMKQLESARQLEVIMNNVTGGVSAIQIHDDGTSTFVFNNEKYYGLYGYTAEQAKAEHLDVMSLVLPEDLPDMMAKVNKLKEDGKSVYIDYRIKKQDGSRALLRANASLMSIPGYGDDVITSVITDITEQRSLEDQLRAILDNINGGITATMIRDGKPEFVIVNSRFFKMLGYTNSEEYELACGGDKYAHIHPEDRARIVAQFESADGGKTRYTMEYRALHKDGSVRYIRNNISVVHLFGFNEPIQLSVANDVTDMVEAQQEQRAAMDRLQTVMSVMSSGMTAVAFEEDGMQFLFSNDRYYEIHGIARGSIGKDHLSNVLELVVPEDRERMHLLIQNAAKTGQSASAEYRIRRPDGAIRWINAVISMTKLVGIDAPVQVTAFSDITEIKEANEQLRFLNDAAHNIMAQPDNDLAVKQTLEDMLAYFAGERTYIFEFNYDTKTSDNTYEICAPGVTSEQGRLQGIPFEVQKFWMDAFQKVGFVAIPEIAKMDDSEADMRALLLSQSIHALIVAPLWRDKTLVGYMGIDNPKKAMDQIGRLQALADYIAVLLTRRDLTRKINHDAEALRTLVNDIPGGFVRMAVHPGGDPSIVSLNDGMCRMLGMRRDEAMAAYGDNAHLLFTPEEIEETAKKVRAALACCGQYSCKCTLHCKAGKDLRVMAFGRFVRDENGGMFLNAYFTDITEQMAAEERQKALLDNLPNGAALYRYDGSKLTVIHINKSYWKLVGRSPADYTNTSVFNVIHPDDRAAIQQEIDSSIRQNRNPETSCRILCGDGTYKPFHIIGTMTPTDDGNRLLCLSYTRIDDDAVSLQKMLPVALSTMMEASDDISYVKDRDLRYICVSQALADMAGLESTRDLIGKSAYDLFDAKYARRLTEDDRRVVETCEPVIGSVEHIPFADGSIHLGRTSKFPLMDAAGKAIGVYCTCHDVTTQKQKESQLELLSGTIPGGLAAYSISKSGIQILYFNDGYYRYSGYTREEYVAMTEKEPLALMFEEDRPRIRAILKSFAAEKKDGMTASCDYRCHKKDGGCLYMNLKASLTRLSEEQYILNVVQLDMTEQVEAEHHRAQLLDNLPFGAALYRLDGQTLTALHINKQFEKMVNRGNTSATTAHSPMDFIHPDDRKLVLDEVVDAIANNRNGCCDARLLYGEGEYRVFHIDARIMKQADGTYLLYAAFSHISEQEMNFKNTLPFIFNTIMESSTDLAFAKDGNFRYMCCSRTFAQLLGLGSEKDVVGKTDYELFSPEIADMFRRGDSALFASERPQIDVVDSIPSADGLLHYIRTSKHLLRDTVGNAVGIYCVGRDVTDVRETDAQLRLLTDSIPGGIATFRCTEKEYQLTYFNDGFCELFGYSKAEFTLTMSDIMDLIFASDRDMVTEQIGTLIRDGTPLNCIYRVHVRGGGYRWLSHNAILADRVKDAAIVNAVFLDITQQQEEKERLQVSEELNRIAIEHSGNIITRFDVANRTLTLPKAFNPIFDVPHVLHNMPEEQIELGRVSADTADAYRGIFEGILRGQAAGTATYKQNSTKGWRWMEAQYTTIFSSTGQPMTAVVSFADITERLEKEVVYNKWQQSLKERPKDSYTLYRCNLSRAASFDSAEGTLIKAAFHTETGGLNERTAEYVAQCVWEEDRKAYGAFLNADTMLAAYYRGHRSDVLEYRERGKDGSACWRRLTVDLVEYPNSKEVEAYLMFEDIDKQKKAALRTLERSEKDPLTGILNRAAFIAKMETCLKEADMGTRHALLMLDIDNFKQINDTLGHAAGDHVLTELTQKIGGVLRRGDFMGRMGGDEFFVFLRDIPDQNAAAAKAKQICALPIAAENEEEAVTTSIGIAIVPDDGSDFDTLYKKVDAALYRQKKHGKNGYLFAEA